MPKSERRITLRNIFDVEKEIELLTGGNEESKNILKALCAVTPYSPVYFYIMDANGIHDRNIIRVYNACCKDIEYFIETMNSLLEGELTIGELKHACPYWD